MDCDDEMDFDTFEPSEEDILLELSKASSFHIDPTSFVGAKKYFRFYWLDNGLELPAHKLENLEIIDDVYELNRISKQLKLLEISPPLDPVAPPVQPFQWFNGRLIVQLLGRMIVWFLIFTREFNLYRISLNLILCVFSYFLEIGAFHYMLRSLENLLNDPPPVPVPPIPVAVSQAQERDQEVDDVIPDIEPQIVARRRYPDNAPNPYPEQYQQAATDYINKENNAANTLPRNIAVSGNVPTALPPQIHDRPPTDAVPAAEPIPFPVANPPPPPAVLVPSLWVRCLRTMIRSLRSGVGLPEGGGFLVDVLSFFLAFVLSLVPEWNAFGNV